MLNRNLGTRRDNGFVCLLYLSFDRLRVTGRKIGVGHRVIGDQVTFCRNTADEIGMVFDIRAEDEKGGWYAVFGEHIQDLASTFRIGTVVERQVDATIVAPAVIQRHFAYIRAPLHSSHPFRSINDPEGHSLIGRPIGNTRTSTSSVRVEGILGSTSGRVERTRTPVTILEIPSRQNLSTWFRIACRTVPNANGTASSCKAGAKARIE
ncbi:hypothetical protein BAE36_21565 [Rhizobium leguminosarum bv. trifolii]|nr:hypothetical protein BAE36_21565 [Rhizobium leguminosarum bv. trifolii]